MSTLDYCDAVTQTGKLCKRRATCDSSKKGEKYCKQHFENYYDPSEGKFIVQRVKRVAHDKQTGLPMRYVGGLTKQEKNLYKKEIEETNRYYKKTGLVKGREDVKKISRSRGSNIRRFQRGTTRVKSTRSSYSQEFERRYGFKVSELKKVKKMFPDTDINRILAKGRAAYASGSRPSMTGKGGIEAWAYARLASVLVGGKSLSVDKDLVGPKSLKVIFRK